RTQTHTQKTKREGRLVCLHRAALRLASLATLIIACLNETGRECRVKRHSWRSGDEGVCVSVCVCVCVYPGKPQPLPANTDKHFTRTQHGGQRNHRYASFQGY